MASTNHIVTRDKLINDLHAIDKIVHFYWVDGFQERLTGRNGGGDPYHTDGRLAVAVLVPTKD